jgi:hypothetical protein
VWSKAVIGATIATAVLLPLLGVPLLGERGALYRAMGVLTAAAPCALVSGFGIGDGRRARGWRWGCLGGWVDPGQHTQ